MASKNSSNQKPKSGTKKPRKFAINKSRTPSLNAKPREDYAPSRFLGLLPYTEKVRLYLNDHQREALYSALYQTRRLYNALLECNVNAYTNNQKWTLADSISFITSQRHDPDSPLASIYRECLDATARRLHNAVSRIFTVKGTGKPRFKSAPQWQSLVFPHGDRAIKLNTSQTKVYIPGVGSVSLRKGRTIPLNYGRVVVHVKNGKWYVNFECHRSIEPLPKTGKVIAADAGINVLVALSDGTLIQNPQFGRVSHDDIVRLQRQLDSIAKKDKNGKILNSRDHDYRKAKWQFSIAHEKISNRRRDYLHKISRWFVNNFDVICHEDLSLKNMTKSAKGTIEQPGKNVAQKSGLNRSLLDASLGMLLILISEKAEWAARVMLGVDPKYTSQMCNACEHIAPENRSGIVFKCISCGHTDHADINAAKNILDKAWLTLSRDASSTKVEPKMAIARCNAIVS